MAENKNLKGDVKAAAKDTSFTYSEIMQIGVAAIDEHLVGRDGEGNVYLTTDDTQGNTTTHTNEELEAIVAEIKDELSMAPEYGVDEEEIVKRVCSRLDDLESQLPTKVAREIQQ